MIKGILSEEKTIGNLSENKIIGEFSGELTNCFDNGKLLLTDDGNVGDLYDYTFPYAVANNLPITFYVVGTGFPEDWIAGGEALEMHNAGMDIQCHSKDHSADITDMDEDGITEEVTYNNTAFVAAGIPSPEHSAYPYGYNTNKIKAIWGQYRKTCRTYETELDDFVYFYRDVNKFEIPGNHVPCPFVEANMDALKSKLDEAQANKAAMSFMWHGGGEDCIEMIGIIISYAQSIGMDIINMSQLYPLLWRRYLVGLKIVNQYGKKIINADIVFDGKEFSSDDDGYYSFMYKEGVFNVTISRDDCQTYTGTITVDGANVFEEIILQQDNALYFHNEEYSGGLIFHIFEIGEYGYVAGEQRGIIVGDYITPEQWGCRGTAVGTTRTEIGYGKENTDDIVAFHAGWVENGGWEGGIGIGGAGDTCHVDNNGEVSAKTVDDLVQDGYNDWHLPSRDELQKIYEVCYINGYGNIYSSNCQSSSEYDAERFFAKNMENNAWQNLKKTNNYVYIHPCRYFARRIADYTPDGDIENISDDVIFYDGAFYVPYDVTTFTFDDDGIGKTANYVDGEWNFT